MILIVATGICTSSSAICSSDSNQIITSCDVFCITIVWFNTGFYIQYDITYLVFRGWLVCLFSLNVGRNKWWLLLALCYLCVIIRVTLFSAISLAVPPAVLHAIIATLRHAAALFQQIHAYSCAFRICHSFWTNRQLQHDSCGILFLFPWKHLVNDQKTCCQQMIWGDYSRQWITHSRYRNQPERGKYKNQ